MWCWKANGTKKFIDSMNLWTIEWMKGGKRENVWLAWDKIIIMKVFQRSEERRKRKRIKTSKQQFNRG